MGGRIISTFNAGPGRVSWTVNGRCGRVGNDCVGVQAGSLHALLLALAIPKHGLMAPGDAFWIPVRPGPATVHILINWSSLLLIGLSE